jgi:eukaryotic translation initiation factor 2C
LCAAVSSSECFVQHDSDSRSFRYSNSGLPLINIDLDFSAFVSSGPALEVVNRILGSGPGGMRGGPVGHPGGFDELNEGQIAILKRKLRGAKVSSLRL